MLKYKLFSFLMIITFTSAQDGSVGRRVPSFVGMRGKKNELEPEKEIPIIDFDVTDKLQDNSDEIRYHMTKRAHFGFQGTRGKKLTETPYKRVVGFTGKINVLIFFLFLRTAAFDNKMYLINFFFLFIFFTSIYLVL